MKKYQLFFLLILLLLGGCSHQQPPEQTTEEKKLSVVTTIFPTYDWTRQIVGNSEDIKVNLLSDKGVDMHSFQPTTDDIIKINSCDLFIYVGGESDEWIKDILNETTNENQKVINLLETLQDDALKEEIIEGMQYSTEEDAYDEHVWLSLSNAQLFTQAIADALVEIEPDKATVYQNNAIAYCQQLATLDEKYQETIKNGTKHTLLFADRFPFCYLCADYALNYYAAFPGCSAETEASFETIVFLANKVDELQLKTIIQLENSDGRLSETLKQTTTSKDQQILTLDSMQAINKDAIKAGVTYLSIMEKNLTVLKEALK